MFLYLLTCTRVVIFLDCFWNVFGVVFFLLQTTFTFLYKLLIFCCGFCCWLGLLLFVIFLFCGIFLLFFFFLIGNVEQKVSPQNKGKFRLCIVYCVLCIVLFDGSFFVLFYFFFEQINIFGSRIFWRFGRNFAKKLSYVVTNFHNTQYNFTQYN